MIIEPFGGWSDIFSRVDGRGSKPFENEPVSVKSTLVKRPPIPESISLTETFQGDTREGAQEVQQFNVLLGEECAALDRSLGQIVNAMKASTVEDFESRVSEWANSYTRSADQLKLAYSSVQQSQKFLKRGLSIAGDPSLQFLGAGLRSGENISAYTLSSFATVDYSTGVKYSYEKVGLAPGQVAPSAPKYQSEIGTISGDYKKAIKFFSGITALGGAATWFAKSHIIGRAEASLTMMQDRLRAIEGGDIGHVLIWIDHIIEECKDDTERMKFLLSEQGIDIDDLKNELGHEVKPEDLQTKKGREAILNLLSESLRKEIVELNTFVTLQKQQLKVEAASLAVSTTKFGSELIGFIMSTASMTTYIPNAVSSTLFLAGAGVKFHQTKKSFQRLSHYGQEIQQGAVAIDKSKSPEGLKNDFWGKVAEKKFQEIITVIFPKEHKKLKMIPIDSTVEKQLAQYGIRLSVLKKNIRGEPIKNLADLLRSDVRKLIIEQLKIQQRESFLNRMAEKKYEEMAAVVIPFSIEKQKDTPIDLKIAEQLKNHGIDVKELNKFLDKPITNLADLSRPDVRRLIVDQFAAKEKVVTAIEAHLGRMQQAKLTNKSKIRRSFKKMAKLLEKENPKKSPVELVTIFQKQFLEKFALQIDFKGLYELELKKMTKGEALSFLTFIEQQTENAVEKVAGHQESMNVTTRNFFRTLAVEKVKAEKPLAKWALGTAGISVGAGTVGLLTTFLSIVTLVGLASLGIAATWLGLGVSVALVVGFAVGIGVLYYYKPHVYKSLFSLNAIKANYANLRMARRTFDLVQVNHQKNMVAVEALNEKVNIHLSAVEMLERLYSQDNKVQKQWAKKKLEALGLINSRGKFDQTTWKGRKNQLEEAQYRKIRDKIGKLTLGHYLELGAFGIGARKVNVGTWVENTLEVIKNDADKKGWGVKEIREALIEAVKNDFDSRGYSFNDRDLSVLERIGNRIQSVEDLDNPSFKSSYLIFYTTSYLEKDIERQKDKSGKFFDSYNNLRKYSKEHGKRLQVSGFDDTMNRIVYGTAHGNIEKSANKRYKKIKVLIEILANKYGKDTKIDADLREKLVKLGVNPDWLARDLKLENMDSVNTLGDLLKDDVRRLILNQCRDRVNFKKKNSEVIQVMNRVIIHYAKSERIHTKNEIKNIPLSDDLKQLLAAEGIDVYRVIKALKPTVSVETVGDLNKKEVKREIARRFRVDWYQLFKEAPTNIAKGIQGDLIDPLTAEFLSTELGIDIQAVAKGMSLPQIQQYIAMGGVELDAFLKKREFLATISTTV
jgi:hypothetical protein